MQVVVTSPCWMSLDYVTHRQSVIDIVHEPPDAAANMAARRRIVICLEVIKAQNSMVAASALGSAHWVFTRRLNSPCRRLIALVVRRDFHCCGGYP